MKRTILGFMRGECTSPVGDRLEDIWEWTNQRIEMDHDFIQWAFPSNEPSGLNRDAPTMTLDDHLEFMQDYDLQATMKRSFLRMLDYFGFVLVEDGNKTLGEKVVIECMEPTDERPEPLQWMNEFNHNMLRVTRVLKSLRLTGLERYAFAFFEALSVFKNAVSSRTYNFWRTATYDKLPFGQGSLVWKNQSESIELEF